LSTLIMYANLKQLKFTKKIRFLLASSKKKRDMAFFGKICL
jgi:hypothetical protein